MRISAIIFVIFYCISFFRLEAKEWKPRKWEDRHTKLMVGQSRGPYVKDPHTWIYNSAFAKRYGMPKEWIDDRLTGVEAVAFRVEYPDVKRCGYFNSAESCGQKYLCKIDFYIKDSANIAWKDNRIQGFRAKEPIYSMHFLAKQHEDEFLTYDPTKRGNVNLYQARIGPYVRYSRGFNSVTKEGSNFDSLYWLAFDKEFLHEINYLSMNSCSLPSDRKKDVSVIFYNHPKKESERLGKSSISHILTMPKSYINRINQAKEKVLKEMRLRFELEKKFIKELTGND